MILLTIRNHFGTLNYGLWNMNRTTPECLLKGKIDNIGNDQHGYHFYNYRYGSGKGDSKNLSFREAIGKIDSVITMIGKAYKRIENLDISVEAIGYLLNETINVIFKTNHILSPSLLMELKKTDKAIQSSENSTNSNLNLLETGFKYFPSATHIAISDGIPENFASPEVRYYPLPSGITGDGKINRFTNGGMRLFSIISSVRRFIGELPRRIIICDIDETTQITAIKREVIVASTHECGGKSSIFSMSDCGAINPALLHYITSITNLSLEEILKILTTKSGLMLDSKNQCNMENIFTSTNIKEAPLHTRMLLNRIIYSIAGQVAILGGIDLLVISGEIGIKSPIIRSLIVNNLPILKLTLDESKNESKITEATEISPPNAKVRIIAVNSDADMQLAEETFKMTQKSKG